MSLAKALIEILQERRVLVLLLLTLAAVGWVYWNGGPFGGGLKFGIDFSGGLRIPVVLERSVDPPTMQDIVNTVKTRAATFGLTEVRVRPVGDAELYVEVPKTHPGLVQDIEQLLSKQGVYEGIVDGQVAITGEDIFPNTIGRLPASQAGGADWAVSFSTTPAGQERFARVVKGKANYPLYMFLDRPADSVVILSRADLMYNANASSALSPGLIREEDALKMAREALRLEGGSGNISLYLQEDLESRLNETDSLSFPRPATNKTRAILSSAAPSGLKERLNASGFAVSEFSPTDMEPHYAGTGQSIGDGVSRWEAVGLKSAPRLSPSVTEGVPSFSYSITGAADGVGQARALSADKNAREMMALLKGGALPVQITLGAVQEIPAPLGQEFLRLSVIGAAFAMLCISLMVAARYRTPKVVLPIVFISISEVVILVAIIGSFSIDLAAMAGLIAAIGVSVDAQIVVTDEILKHETAEDASRKLDKAFSIIITNAIVATVAMLPLLLFSGLVEIIGFATSTILGYLLGVLISRPAYGVIVKHVVGGRTQ